MTTQGRSLADYLLIIIIVLVLFVGGAECFSAWAPSPLTYTNVPFPVVEPQVHPGDTEPLLIARCANSPFEGDLAYAVAHNLVNDVTGETYILPATFSNVAKGCSGPEVSMIHQVPITAKPGRYHFTGAAHVVGRFKTEDVTWVSQSFDVVP